MEKKLVGLTLGAMLFALWFPADAQQPARVAKIGWLGERGSGSGRAVPGG